MKVLIVGGVAGGASAAARMRRMDENAQIILFERGPYISFANCGLPYYISRTIGTKDDLLVQTPESFYGRFRVEVRTQEEVIAIDREHKTVRVRRGEGDIYEEGYDKLILSPGADAVLPGAIRGLNSQGVFVLRSVPEVVAIDRWIEERRVKHAVIAGGGYIGIELAENLRERGLEVTVVELASHVIGSIDEEIAHIAEKELEKHGINLRLNCGITAIEEKENGLHITTTDGSLEAGLAVISVGVKPNSDLAREAGLELGFRGCIAVNDRMQTSDPDIYAVGDAVEVTEFVTGQKRHIALAGPANRQGRIAANQIAGMDSRYKGTQGSSIIKVFDIAVAATGLTEAAAKAAGIDCDKVYLHSGAHAGYYPGAKPLTLKIVFERATGRLLGGQFVGAEGADKRCDVLAVAIRAGLTAMDLADLELCYAPPYNSAKDPLNMAGFAIENIVTGKVKNFHWEQVPALDGEAVTLLDVRTDNEYAQGSVPGFVHIPLHELRERIGELPKEKPVYVHCFSGLRSYVACRILTGHGYDCYNISGGYRMYGEILPPDWNESGEGSMLRAAEVK